MMCLTGSWLAPPAVGRFALRASLRVPQLGSGQSGDALSRAAFRGLKPLANPEKGKGGSRSPSGMTSKKSKGNSKNNSNSNRKCSKSDSRFLRYAAE